VVIAVHVFGSYARGAPEPHDLDLNVQVNRHDDRWLSHFTTSQSYGRVGFQNAAIGW
jgi:predicted nucleotidyltransferase